jgi:hypothetical protein
VFPSFDSPKKEEPKSLNSFPTFDEPTKTSSDVFPSFDSPKKEAPSSYSSFPSFVEQKKEESTAVDEPMKDDTNIFNSFPAYGETLKHDESPEYEEKEFVDTEEEPPLIRPKSPKDKEPKQTKFSFEKSSFSSTPTQQAPIQETAEHITEQRPAEVDTVRQKIQSIPDEASDYDFTFQPFITLQSVDECLEEVRAESLPDGIQKERCPTPNLFGIDDAMITFISKQNQVQVRQAFAISPKYVPIDQLKSYQNILCFCQSNM